MERLKKIEDLAATLLAKRDSGVWTDDDQAQLVAWMEEATAYRIAVLRLEAAWESAGRLKALSAGLPRDMVPPAGGWKHSPFFESHGCAVVVAAEFQQASSSGNLRAPRARRRWPYFATSVAASILLALVFAGAWYLWPAGERYSTPIGGVASVPLRDGSNITLNTASQVRVELTTTERYVRLDRGEVFFEVAKDPSRPFVVQVGNKRVVAVGTKFSVRRDGDEIRVAVTEGKVKVPKQDGSADVFVPAGSVASADDSGILVRAKSLAEVEEDLSWRRGYLTFHETTLADAVAEFNRYNNHKISIEDVQVAAIRISGTFRPTNYEAFVRLLQDGFSIHATSTEEGTSLTN